MRHLTLEILFILQYFTLLSNTNIYTNKYKNKSFGTYYKNKKANTSFLKVSSDCDKIELNKTGYTLYLLIFKKYIQ